MRDSKHFSNNAAPRLPVPTDYNKDASEVASLASERVSWSGELSGELSGEKLSVHVIICGLVEFFGTYLFVRFNPNSALLALVVRTVPFLEVEFVSLCFA